MLAAACRFAMRCPFVRAPARNGNTWRRDPSARQQQNLTAVDLSRSAPADDLGDFHLAIVNHHS